MFSNLVAVVVAAAAAADNAVGALQ